MKRKGVEVRKRDRHRKAVRSAVALVVGVFVVLTYGPAAYAATLTVNTTADELNVNGNCSLREALQAANTDTAVDACAVGRGTTGC